MTVIFSRIPVLSEQTANPNRIAKCVEVFNALATCRMTKTIFLLRHTPDAGLQSPEGGCGEEGSFIVVVRIHSTPLLVGGAAIRVQCSVRQ
jgi:hypothetical protein